MECNRFSIQQGADYRLSLVPNPDRLPAHQVLRFHPYTQVQLILNCNAHEMNRLVITPSSLLISPQELNRVSVQHEHATVAQEL